MSNQAVGYDAFLRLLERRLKGRYSIAVLHSVLASYASQSAGIGSKLKVHSEFKDAYFGGFRLTQKGIENLGLEMEQGLNGKAELSRFSHELALHKKQHEKRNNAIWKARNMLVGYKFKNAFADSFRKIRNTYKSQQLLYLNGQLRKTLKNNRKTKI